MPYLLPDTIDPDRVGVCVQVPDDPNHIRAFLGALHELTWARNWGNDGTDTGLQVSRVWTDVYDDVSAKIGETVCEESEVSCKSYPNTAPFIQYFPNDPRYTPDLTPEGYIAPPWYFATTASNFFLGTHDGDIVTSIDRFPIGSLPTIIPPGGFPRIRVNVNVQAGGVVRVYLRNMFDGGFVQTTVDDDILTLQFHDVLRDVVSIPPETSPQVLFEWTFQEAGVHYIDLIALTNVNDAIPFVFHGAAIERVEICGEAQELPYVTNVEVVDCELRVELEGQPGYSVVGRVMTPEPNCEFENTVSIEASDTSEQAYIQARNDMIASDAGVKTATRLEASLTDAGGLKLVGMIRHAWNNVTNQDAELTLHALVEGVLRQVASFAENGRAMTLNIWRDQGQTEGLEIVDQAGSATGADTIQVFQLGRSVFRLGGTGLMRLWRRNATTNQVISAVDLHAFNSTATPANGFGTMVQFKAQSSTTEDRLIGQVQGVWDNVTDAARVGALKLRPADENGPQTAIEATRNSGETRVGFHGAEPIIKPTITGATPYDAMAGLLEAMDDYGLIDNQAGDGDPVLITGALGDRNLPPVSVSNECAAANELAAAIQQRIVQGFAVVGDQRDVYDILNGAHGNVTANLWSLAGLIDANSASQTSILAEISASLGDMVIQIASDLYNQTAHAVWALNYGSYASATGLIVQAAITSYTVPTWAEIAYIGSEVGTETYSCDPCVGGPSGTYDWAVEWSGSALSSDWSANPALCGTGLSLDAGCGGFYATWDGEFTPANSGATCEIRAIGVDISYSFNEDRQMDGRLAFGSGTIQFDLSSSVNGVGTLTLEKTGLTSGDVGQDWDLQVFNLTGGNWDGESASITRIWAAGTLAAPESNAANCM